MIPPFSPVFVLVPEFINFRFVMKQTCNEPPDSHACAIHSIEPIVTEGKSLEVDAVVASHEPFSKYVKRFHVRIGCPSLDAEMILRP
jgi:hypothetical protein